MNHIPQPRSIIPGSFRDPSGFMFVHEGILYRQVASSYRDAYEHLMRSGLYKALVEAQQLIPHEDLGRDVAFASDAHTVLKPESIPFISYPYEWCFSQLKDAALLTLQIQRTALDHEMSLKDCSAYNVQFRAGRPILIDTLSFERYREGQPWVAYRQFCQHFLAPLALMRYRDVRLGQLLRVHLDGLPLDMASSLLPFRTWLRFPLLAHLHLHAKAQQRFAGRQVRAGRLQVSRSALRGLVDSLEAGIRGLRWQPRGTP